MVYKVRVKLAEITIEVFKTFNEMWAKETHIETYFAVLLILYCRPQDFFKNEIVGHTTSRDSYL